MPKNIFDAEMNEKAKKGVVKILIRGGVEVWFARPNADFVSRLGGLALPNGHNEREHSKPQLVCQLNLFMKNEPP